jgi:LPS-assembly protein
VTCKAKGPFFPFKTIYSVIPLTAFLWLITPANLLAQQAQESLQTPDVARESWTPIAELPPELRDTIAEACCGIYRNPQQPPAISDGSILVEASRAEFDGNNQQTVIKGDIDIRFADTWLQADQGIVDKLAGIVELSGNIRLRKSGLSIGATSASVNTANAYSQLKNTSYVLHELAARGSADKLIFDQNENLLLINEGTYTVCEPGDDIWLLAGETIELNQNSGRGSGRNIVLRVKNIPLFYTPYISFPINEERSSGLLYPSIGSTREGGFDYEQPYYFNIAPNYDATLSPRLMSERGLMLGLEGRYLGTKANSQINLNYLHDDAQFDPTIVNLPGTQSPSQAKRWQINYQGAATISDNFIAQANFSAISDFDYFQDFGAQGLDNTTRSYLYRHGELAYRQDSLQLVAALQSFQQIDPGLTDLSKPYSALPRINMNYSGELMQNWHYELPSEYVFFERQLDSAQLSQTQIDNGALLKGQRLSLSPRLSWRWQQPGIFATPSVGYDYTQYRLDEQASGKPDTIERGIAMGSLASGLIFERPLQIQGTDYRQTLEPRLFYLYRDYENQDDIPLFDTADLSSGFNQLFRENRFSGRDRIADANQLTLALTTRFLNEQGQQKASLSLGQIVYFDDGRVGLTSLAANRESSSSSLITQFNYQFNQNWRLGLYREWSHDTDDIDAASFQFRYQSDINQILNFSYRYRDSTNIPGLIKQTDISALWPMTDNLGLIARWNYDHANSRDLESIIGLAYSSCCWDMRIIARRWLDNTDLSGNFVRENNGIFIQFELKGLGNILGNSIDSFIGNSIAGFKNYDENN